MGNNESRENAAPSPGATPTQSGENTESVVPTVSDISANEASQPKKEAPKEKEDMDEHVDPIVEAGLEAPIPPHNSNSDDDEDDGDDSNEAESGEGEPLPPGLTDSQDGDNERRNSMASVSSDGYFSSRKEVDPNDGEFPFDFSAVGLHYRAPFNMRDPLPLRYAWENGLSIKQAAEIGNANDQILLAQLLEEGKAGMEQSQEQARYWYTQAKQQGKADAMVYLAHMMLEGRGGPRDDNGAVRLLHLAAAKGQTEGYYCPPFILQYCVNLYVCAQQLLFVEDSEKAAFGWYTDAAKKGDMVAQHSLGYLYENGKGVKEDFDEASDWYRRSAGQKFAAAMVGLGRLSHEGKGISDDPRVAEKWFRQAAKLNHPAGVHNLNLLIGERDDDAFDQWASRRGIKGEKTTRRMAIHQHTAKQKLKLHNERSKEFDTDQENLS